MCIQFCSITKARSDIKKLTKKKAYSKCRSDICGVFKDMPFSLLYERGKSILENREIGSRLIKFRIINSNNSNGHSGGYRIYYIAEPNIKRITIITIYPKTGSMRKDNLEDSEKETLIHEFLDERDTGKLVFHDLSKLFAEK